MATASPDHAAILSLMSAETAAFLRRDFDALRGYWVDAPHSRFLISWPGVGARVYRGVEEIVAMLSASSAEAPPVETVEDRLELQNVSLVVGADMAWATYDQVSRGNDPDFLLNGVQHELMIFQRENGTWKIACVVVLAEALEHLPDPLIEVGADLRILWVNSSARAALGTHPGLHVVGRRLAARKRDFDAGLRAAVLWAQSKRFANPRKHLASAERIRAVPLGEDDEGTPHFCWIFIEDGRVLVAFDSREADSNRLDRAREVFSLSPAQMRLARLIVHGDDLSTAADHLGISINTARTQLNRMFQKTGVHNQAGLVRRLITLGVPTKG